MRLEDVLPAFRAGKKIKRTVWSDSLHKDELSSQVSFNRDALFSNDWEIVEEKPSPQKTKTVWMWGFKAGERFYNSTRLLNEQEAEKEGNGKYFKISKPIEVPCDE